MCSKKPSVRKKNFLDKMRNYIVQWIKYLKKIARVGECSEIKYDLLSLVVIGTVLFNLGGENPNIDGNESKSKTIFLIKYLSVKHS